MKKRPTIYILICYLLLTNGSIINVRAMPKRTGKQNAIAALTGIFCCWRTIEILLSQRRREHTSRRLVTLRWRRQLMRLFIASIDMFVMSLLADDIYRRDR